MKRLGQIGNAYLRHRRGRSVLTLLGITLGVASLFGVLVSNATQQANADARRLASSGLAQVLVRGVGQYGAALPTDKVESLVSDARVVDVGYLVRVTADEPSGAVMSLVGADERSPDIGRWQLTDGRLPSPGAPEVLHTEGHGPGVGGSIGVVTPSATEELVVVGTLADIGIGSWDDSTVRITSMATAHRLMGSDDVVHDARIVLADGVDADAWRAEMEARFPGLRIDDARSGYNDFGQVSQALVFVSAVTMFIAGFLIYLTLSAAIMERTTEYGTLRALGATRSQVSRVVLREAAMLGVAGAGLGLAAGTGLGALMSRVTGDDDPITVGLRVPVGSAVIAFACGLVMAVLAAYLPARRAGRLEPAVAMKSELALRSTRSRAWIVGLVLACIGASVSVATPFPVSIVGNQILMLGVVLLVPLVLGPLAAGAGFVLRRFTKGLTTVTVMHLVRERSRSAYTLGLILVVLAFGIALAGTQESLHRIAEDTSRLQWQAPISVISPAPMSEASVEAVTGADGVRAVSPIRFGTSHLVDADGEHWTGLIIVDEESFFDVQDLAWESGDRDGARVGLADGGIVLARPEAERRHLSIGEMATLRTADGTAELPVVGLTGGLGRSDAYISLDTARSLFGVGDPHWLVADVEDGRVPAEVRSTLRGILGAGSDLQDDSRFNVVGPEAFAADFSAGIDSAVSIFFAVLFVAMCAGFLGLANTLAMAVVQRRREVGIMRALGATTTDIAATIVVEAAILAGSAYVLAIPLGWFLGWGMLDSVFSQLGFSGSFAGPGSMLPALAVVTIVVSLLASYLPARRASRTVIVDALRVE